MKVSLSRFFIQLKILLNYLRECFNWQVIFISNATFFTASNFFQIYLKFILNFYQFFYDWKDAENKVKIRNEVNFLNEAKNLKMFL